MTRHEELVRQGWEKQSTYDEPRLSEMVAAYEEIGFEVRLEPIEPDTMPECSECMREHPENFKTIFTRRRLRVSPGV